MKTTKNLTEMTTTELREEIGRLQTELNRVHTKNKRRRKALREMNRNALVNFKLRGDLQGEVRYLRTSVKILNDHLTHVQRNQVVTGTLELRKVPEERKPGFFSRLLGGRNVRGTSGT